MPPRRKPAPPPVPTLTLTGGTLVVLLLSGLGWVIWKYPREACAVGVTLCSERLQPAPAPVVMVAPIPEEPLDGQVQARDGACPSGYRAINRGCWIAIEQRPPCPLGTYEHERRCWSPYVPPQRFPSVQQPWNRR